MERLEIKKNIQKPEDQNLSFRAFDLTQSNLKNYFEPHKKDHFCILMVQTGEIGIQIENQIFNLG